MCDFKYGKPTKAVGKHTWPSAPMCCPAAAITAACCAAAAAYASAAASVGYLCSKPTVPFSVVFRQTCALVRSSTHTM